MRFALFIVLSLSAMAFAGPAYNKDNQIQSQETTYKQQQQDQAMASAKSPIIDILSKWCFSSQMSQQELTNSFKKLVETVKSNPSDKIAQSAVMSGRICMSQQQQQQADAQAHELIKDVYMDALISANTRESTQQLLEIVQSQKVDSIRAAYYMTRIAVTDKQSLKDESQVKELAESFLENAHNSQQSEAIERQKLFATTALIAKAITQKQPSAEITSTAEQVAKVIVDRYVKTVSEQEVEQYKQESERASPELAKKIAKRTAALQALASIPGDVLDKASDVSEALAKIATSKRELSTARQSAIECFAQCPKQMSLLKQLAYDQQEPTEVRVAAFRALMSAAGAMNQDSNNSPQALKAEAQEIVAQAVKHCESEQNQSEDEQFVQYVASYLDNARTSQQPEQQAAKEAIAANKQHYMQIQVLAKKLKQQAKSARRTSRNYKLEQEFNQLESGLMLEGDIVYGDDKSEILPKVVRANMSMPIMGATVNVVEITLRQAEMDAEILAALKVAQSAKFASESVAKATEAFKSAAQRQQAKSGACAEADLTIKVDGCTVAYVSAADFKAAAAYAKASSSEHSRQARSAGYGAGSLTDELLGFLKRKPIDFNRGFNFNINERIAKVLDVEANVVAGLRFESRAAGHSADDFELAIKMAPRLSVEAIVGPAKMNAKKLLQRASTKTALGFRLRFKRDQLVDAQLDLPMDTMELFTVESQLVEKSGDSYAYLADSAYGAQDIYGAQAHPNYIDYTDAADKKNGYFGAKLAKGSGIMGFGKREGAFGQLLKGKAVSRQFQTPDMVERATGLAGKLRVSAAPKHMAFFATAVVEKTQPEMEGVRVQIAKQAQTYVISVSTPGARPARNMQVRVSSQLSGARKQVKAEIEGARTAAALTLEAVNESRMTSAKVELTTRDMHTQKQTRHFAEVGLTKTASKSRLTSFSYKPYMQVESSALQRPIALQGQLSYVKSPKSVITYELKGGPNGADYVQGKLIVDARDKQAHMRAAYRKRSMQSPIELALSTDLTLTNELIGQYGQHAVKVQNMFDWDSQKYAVAADATASYKDMRKPQSEDQFVFAMKADSDEQTFSVERKGPRAQFSARATSHVRPDGHQMEAEAHFGRNKQQSLGYKHKVTAQQVASGKYDAKFEVEVEQNAKTARAQGRARLNASRQMKQLQLELGAGASQQFSAKIDAEYTSAAQSVEVFVQAGRFSHTTELRNDKQRFSVKSRTEQPATKRVYAKLMVEAPKTGEPECKIALDVPAKQMSASVDLKFAPGRRSSLAVQSGRFASQMEFSFEMVPTPKAIAGLYPFARAANVRVRSQLKDAANKQAYWMDSQLNADHDKASFLRLDSPQYRTELEYEPRSQTAKLGAYARAQPSRAGAYAAYAKDAAMWAKAMAGELEKPQLDANKLWAVRSIIGSETGREQLANAARRALVEYVDKDQTHRHSISWSPEEERINMDFAHGPAGAKDAFGQTRIAAAVSTRPTHPSTATIDTDWLSASAEAKPAFLADDNSESYATLTALSRQPRSAFKKHDSQIRYSRDHGYKADVRHETADGKRHELRAEAAAKPAHWAKVAYDSDKHGKAAWEHKWRAQQKKRAADQADVYASRASFKAAGPQTGDQWKHESQLDWDEPMHKTGRRERRSAHAQNYFEDAFSKYADFLRSASARLNSATTRADGQKYALDFDYQPHANFANVNMKMPEDMQHAASFELKPSENAFKLSSKLFNARTGKPTYELAAATKSADQFVQPAHPMLERATDAPAFNMFRWPIKVDYSDKSGRKASFDYDQIAGAQIGDQLRQKRATAYYNDGADFQHESTVDFYFFPLFGGIRYNKDMGMAPVAFKTNTKYGPIEVRAASSAAVTEIDVKSPLADAKFAAVTDASGTRKLISASLDNKSQRVQLAKLMREYAPSAVRDNKAIRKIAAKFDAGRFEKQTELLVGIVDQIYKVKSSAKYNERPILALECEYNAPAGKAYAKINGEAVDGQATFDLARQTAELSLDIDAGAQYKKIHHFTSLTPAGNQFYKLQSMTTRDGQPIFKLSGKVAAAAFEPAHVFSRGQKYANSAEHLSSFEAVIYEPKQIFVSGQFNCEQKEARIVFKDAEEQRTHETQIRFDNQSESVFARSMLSSPAAGTIYEATAKISIPGVSHAAECTHGAHAMKATCMSELAYTESKIAGGAGKMFSAQYYPGQYATVVTPRGQSTFNLAY